MDPDDTQQAAQPAEDGNVTQLDLYKNFGEIRQGSYYQERIRVTQVVDDHQRRAAAGIILQPKDRGFGTYKDNQPALERENPPKKTPRRSQARQAGETRLPNFANWLWG
jgi:hypothetical protein